MRIKSFKLIETARVDIRSIILTNTQLVALLEQNELAFVDTVVDYLHLFMQWSTV